MTKTDKQIIEEFREQFTEQEGFGGIGGSGVRTVIQWPDNPDYSHEILIDNIEQFILAATAKTRAATIEEIANRNVAICDKCLGIYKTEGHKNCPKLKTEQGEEK